MSFYCSLDFFLRNNTSSELDLTEVFLFFLFLFFIWLDDPHTSTTSASLVDGVNSAYCQSSGAYNIKHINLWKLTLRGHLNTDAEARARTRNILLTRTMPEPLGYSSTELRDSK